MKQTGEVKSYLASLYNAGISNFRGVNYYGILDGVMNCLFNNTNLFNIIYQLELLKLSNTEGRFYNDFQIMHRLLGIPNAAFCYLGTLSNNFRIQKDHISLMVKEYM